jgi:hypothetical protein
MAKPEKDRLTPQSHTRTAADSVAAKSEKGNVVQTTDYLLNKLSAKIESRQQPPKSAVQRNRRYPDTNSTVFPQTAIAQKPAATVETDTQSVNSLKLKA